MATPDQRSRLLAIVCPWCQAARGEFCSRPGVGHNERDSGDGVRRKARLPISTLDGGCHDARWQAAGLGTAPVLGEVLDELRGVPLRRVQGPEASPELVGAGPVARDGARPW